MASVQTPTNCPYNTQNDLQCAPIKGPDFAQKCPRDSPRAFPEEAQNNPRDCPQNPPEDSQGTLHVVPSFSPRNPPKERPRGRLRKRPNIHPYHFSEALPEKISENAHKFAQATDPTKLPDITQ